MNNLLFFGLTRLFQLVSFGACQQVYFPNHNVHFDKCNSRKIAEASAFLWPTSAHILTNTTVYIPSKHGSRKHLLFWFEDGVGGFSSRTQ